MRQSVRSLIRFLLVLILFLTGTATLAFSSANVMLQWDANEPAPEGYRVFVREDGHAYDYAHPIWEKNLTTCSLTGLTEGVTYFFVVRAYASGLESVDSEEVSYTPSVVPDDTGTNTDTGNGTDTDTGSSGNANLDTDGDSVVDTLDAFPNDSNEWADNDSDGIGNNQDTDDDNDGMTDDWEIAFGLDPFADDAGLDADGDGVTNLEEFIADSNPTSPVNNNAPDAPIIENASATERVGLTPVLVCSAFIDADNDSHYQSRWQISTEADFTTLILDATSNSQLTAYTVGEMVLDADTVYYWRVRFMDARDGASEWSETATFTTIAVEETGDADSDGIIDAQEVDETSDVNENGVSDSLESTIMTVNTVEGQAMVGVETLSDSVTLVSVKSLSTETIEDQSVALGFGLIGFKLYLAGGVKTASVNIHFSKRVPSDARLYKYTAENGWHVYDNAVFAPNRKSVTLVLEDGGQGDEDGVENGVIVDPSGIAYTSVSESESDTAAVTTGDASAADSSGSSGGSCFISAGMAGIENPEAGLTVWVAAGLTILLLALGMVFLAAVPVKNR